MLAYTYSNASSHLSSFSLESEASSLQYKLQQSSQSARSISFSSESEASAAGVNLMAYLLEFSASFINALQLVKTASSGFIALSDDFTGTSERRFKNAIKELQSIPKLDPFRQEHNTIYFPYELTRSYLFNCTSEKTIIPLWLCDKANHVKVCLVFLGEQDNSNVSTYLLCYFLSLQLAITDSCYHLPFIAIRMLSVSINVFRD